jgi:hypothetical protein
MAEYLHSSVEHLEDLGIHDKQLWLLQEMVAERIETATRPLHGRPAAIRSLEVDRLADGPWALRLPISCRLVAKNGHDEIARQVCS